MGKFIDLSGKQIGYWDVLMWVPGSLNNCNINHWLCRCICGEEVYVQAGHLRSGASTSCGCMSEKRHVHGAAVDGVMDKTYRTWRQIRSRCLNPNNKNADIYNGLLCDEWNDYVKFKDHIGDPPTEDHTIDRINNDRGYEPGNVRWATWTEQHRNQSNCRQITHNGVTKLLTDWAQEIGVSSATLSERIIKLGAGVALSMPSKNKAQQLGFGSNATILRKDDIVDSKTGWAKRMAVSRCVIDRLVLENHFEVLN